MVADVSKTVRFTYRAWLRWERLIGKRSTKTWADVVNAALFDLEKDLVKNGELKAYTPPELVSKTVPSLFDAGEVKDFTAIPSVEVSGRRPCTTCGKDNLVDADGKCATCRLVAQSNGKLTTADKLTPIAGDQVEQLDVGPLVDAYVESKATAAATSPATRSSSSKKAAAATSPATVYAKKLAATRKKKKGVGA